MMFYYYTPAWLFMIVLALLFIFTLSCTPEVPASVKAAKEISVNECEKEVEYLHSRLHRIDERTARAYYSFCREK